MLGKKPVETLKILLSSLKNMKEIFCTLRVNFIRLYNENEKNRTVMSEEFNIKFINQNQSIN